MEIVKIEADDQFETFEYKEVEDSEGNIVKVKDESTVLKATLDNFKAMVTDLDKQIENLKERKVKIQTIVTNASKL